MEHSDTLFVEGVMKKGGGLLLYSRKNNVCKGKGEGTTKEEITDSYLFSTET